ncbi:hypothetical protein ACQJBY_071094 [Aegilops geniculata]
MQRRWSCSCYRSFRINGGGCRRLPLALELAGHRVLRLLGTGVCLLVVCPATALIVVRRAVANCMCNGEAVLVYGVVVHLWRSLLLIVGGGPRSPRGGDGPHGRRPDRRRSSVLSSSVVPCSGGDGFAADDACRHVYVADDPYEKGES